ncbi:hypothetical protein WJX72_006943 [[Myrmecia] bisecta]|uniref:Uncharacterized protein n=1 Tax=[Myrmecia] bisecta TaxID=41462 RepID=A0AAW1QFG9_9CHLO
MMLPQHSQAVADLLGRFTTTLTPHGASFANIVQVAVETLQKETPPSPEAATTLQRILHQHLLVDMPCAGNTYVLTLLPLEQRLQLQAQVACSQALSRWHRPPPWALSMCTGGAASAIAEIEKEVEAAQVHEPAKSQRRARHCRKRRRLTIWRCKAHPALKLTILADAAVTAALARLKAGRRQEQRRAYLARQLQPGSNQAMGQAVRFGPGSQAPATPPDLQALVKLKMQHAAPLIRHAQNALQATILTRVLPSTRSTSNDRCSRAEGLGAGTKLPGFWPRFCNSEEDYRRLRHLQQAKRKDFAAAVLAFRKQNFQPAAAERRTVQEMCNMSVQAWHRAAEEAARLAREAAARERLAMLKANDVEAYLKLLQTGKTARVRELLAHTDACLRHLASRLKIRKKHAQPTAAAAGAGSSGQAQDEGLDAFKHSNEDWNALAMSFDADVKEQPAMLKAGDLRDYQLKGLRWLVSLHDNGLNGILADEMGLGKTIQVIALVAYLVESRSQKGPFLIVAPSSLLPNWESEFQRWAPDLNLVSYKGSAEARAAMFASKVQPRCARFHVLLTSYEFLMGKADRPRLARLHWKYLIIDEGHRLKNADCKLNAELKHYRTDCRLLLTGTPLQNKLEELWALLNFLMPTLFDSSDDFQQWFGSPERTLGLDAEDAEAALLSQEESLLVTNRLHQVLRPFMLRRLKESVATELPDKVEHLLKVPASAYQQALCGLLEAELCKGKAIKGINNTAMELRNICNHPLLSRLHPEGGERSLPGHVLPAEVRLSGKLELLDRVLVKLHAAGHKVLLFSTMTRLLDILEDYLGWRGFDYLRLDGATSAAERGQLVDDFNAPASKAFVFLLSIRAGGVGLNLQAADTVIMYDTDWNPQIDLQAQARAHRIGQKRQVLVLRMQTAGSIEERICSAAAEKRSFADRSITGGFFDMKTSAEERRQYLLHVIRTSAQQQDLAASTSLSDAELNKLLLRGEHEAAIFEREDLRLAQQELAAWQRSAPRGAYSRLVTSDDAAALIAEAQAAAAPVDEDEGRDFGRGKRQRDHVGYVDMGGRAFNKICRNGLSELGWLQ